MAQYSRESVVSQLRTGSIQSFASSPISSSANSTATSASVLGPGSLSSKAILALGKATIRGVEYVVIRRRLAAITSFFPHKDSGAKDNVRHKIKLYRMYKDILELSRPGLYPDALRDQALRLLLHQIGSRQTRQLLQAFSTWSTIETRCLLENVMLRIDPVWMPFETILKGDVMEAYRDSLSIWESHSAVPVVDFIRQVAQVSARACRAVLETGCLNMFLGMYACDFRDTLVGHHRDAFHRKYSLLAACNSALLALSADPWGMRMLQEHPLHILWPRRLQLAFTLSDSNRSVRRYLAWHAVSERKTVQWRIRAIYHLNLDWNITYDQPYLFDVTVDLLEFSGSDTFDEEITSRALRTLHRCISRGNGFIERATSAYLARSSVGHFTALFSRIIDRVAMLGTPSRTADLFFIWWDDGVFKDSVVNHFVRYILTVAADDEDFKGVVIAAGFRELLRSVPLREVEDLPGVDQFFTDPEPLNSIREDSMESLDDDIESANHRVAARLAFDCSVPSRRFSAEVASI